MPTVLSRYPLFFAFCLLVLWNFLLVSFRVHITGQGTFVFFLWNLFLAIIPYFSSKLALHFAATGSRMRATSLLLFSVLFLPNAPYIITDLFHLRARQEMPLWYDTLLIFSVALSSLSFYFASLLNIRRVFARYWKPYWAELPMLLLPFLCSFGIYLGRYLRFNSWDVLSNPNDLMEEIANRLINPSKYTQMVGVTLLYGAFLLVGYGMIRLVEMAAERKNEVGI